MKFEVREVDAWLYDGGWIYNTTYYIGTLTTNAKNERKVFTAWLKKHAGITFKRNRTRIVFDGDIYEIVDRKTQEPLYAMIPLYN